MIYRAVQSVQSALGRLSRPQPNRRKSSSGFASSANWLGYGLVGRNRDFEQSDAGAASAAILIEDIYARLQARIQALDGLGWRIRKRSGNMPAEDDQIVSASNFFKQSHPLGVAFQEFRYRYRYSFFNAYYYSMLVAGEFYIQPLPNDYGYFTGLEWYNPVGMWVDEQRGHIQRYRYSGRSQSITFEPDEIVYDHWLNLVDEFEGVGPVESAIMSANIDRNSKRALTAFFRNGMRVGMVITPKDNQFLGDEEIRSIIREMQDSNQGVDNTGKNLFMPYGADITSAPEQNLANNDAAIERAKRNIGKSLRVPDAVVGDMSATTYKEHRDMYDAFRENVILPDCRHIAEVINVALMRYFDKSGDYYFEFNTDFISERITDIERDIQEMAQRDLLNGVITMAEYNERVGVKMEPDQEKQLAKRLIPSNYLVMPEDQFTNVTYVPGMQVPMPTADAEFGRKLTQAQTAYASGLLTLNQALELTGMPAVANGDVYSINSQNIQVNTEALGEMQAKPSYLPYQNPQSTPQQAQFMASQSGIDVPPAPPPETNTQSQAPIEVVEEVEATQERRGSIQNELKAWEKFAVARAGRKNARRFSPQVIPAKMASVIQSDIDAAVGDPHIIKSVFAEYLNVKTIDEQVFVELANIWDELGLSDLTAGIEQAAEEDVEESAEEIAEDALNV